MPLKQKILGLEGGAWRPALDAAVCLVVLWLTQVALSPFLQPLKSIQEQTGAAQAHASQLHGASGLSLALLSGFRAPVATLTFLRAYTSWQNRDEARTRQWLELAVQLDPRPVEVWVRSAQIIALDMPHWKHKSLGHISPHAWSRLRQSYLEAALEHLQRAEATHPQEPRLPYERARLWLTVFQNRPEAIEALKTAVRTGQASPHIHRLLSDLLVSEGRLPEAHEVLRQHHEQLLGAEHPTEDAQPEYTLYRLRQLEALMNAPET